jgi:hypothetical protein
MRRISFGCLGAILLLAGTLKLTGLLDGSPRGDGWWADFRIQLLAIVWEFVLGGWLLSGSRPLAAGLSTLVTFIGFAGLSGYLGVSGVSSCGCFGAAARTNPWWSFALDVVAIFLLLYYSPPRGSWSQLKAECTGTLPVAAGVSIATVVGLMIVSRYPSADLMFARIRGDTVTARPAMVNVGIGRPEELREGTISVSNWSSQPLKVFGGSSGCDIDILRDCPKTIAPGSTEPFRVRYRLSAVEGWTKRRVQLWAIQEAGSPIPIRFEIGGTTEPNSP